MTYMTAKANKHPLTEAASYLRLHSDREAIAASLVALSDEIGLADVDVSEACLLVAELFIGPPPGRSA